MADFNREGFERRLNRLSETQESIENLSAWVIQQVKFAKAVADSWMHVFHSSRSHRYQTLLYLVNDVLQNGRRRGLDFSLAFREVLPQSLAMAHGQKCQSTIERIISVWEERRVYDIAYLRYLRQCLENGEEFALSNPPSDVSTTTLEMSSASVAERLETFRDFEATLASKLAKLNSTKLNSWNDSMLTAIKDKQEGHQMYEEFEEAMSCLKDCCETMTSEVEHRRNIIAAMEQSLVEQRQEAVLSKKLYKEVNSIDSKVRSVLSAINSRLKSLTKLQGSSQNPSGLNTKTVSDPAVLSQLPTVGSFLLNASQNIRMQEAVEAINEHQKEERETVTDHIDIIEEEDMEIDNSESEDESTQVQPAKVAKTDETTKTPGTKTPQPVGHVNGPLVGINIPENEGGTYVQTDGNSNKTTGHLVNGKPGHIPTDPNMRMDPNMVMDPNMALDPNMAMDHNMGMNHPPHHPVGMPDGHIPPHPMCVPDGPRPNAVCPPPVLHNQQMSPNMPPPMMSPNMLLPPPFMPPPPPILDTQMPGQTGLPPGGMNQSLMGPHPGMLPPQRFNPPHYPNNWQFRGQGRGRGQGGGLHQTQPVPGRFY